jgi:hypothetical protein
VPNTPVVRPKLVDAVDPNRSVVPVLLTGKLGLAVDPKGFPLVLVPNGNVVEVEPKPLCPLPAVCPPKKLPLLDAVPPNPNVVPKALESCVPKVPVKVEVSF